MFLWGILHHRAEQLYAELYTAVVEVILKKLKPDRENKILRNNHSVYQV